MRSARLLALVLLAAGPLAAGAIDAPHEAGPYCSNCHMGHNAPGAALTKEAGNFTLCNSCHLSSANFGFPGWTTSIQAVPGVSGRSHRWDALATSLGATPPDPASSDPDEKAMALRLDAGKLMCSTCHDQHSTTDPPASGRGRQTVSAVTRLDAPVPGTGMVSVGTVVAGATAKGYLLDIVQAGSQTAALFRLSNDNGTSWFGCAGATTYTYVTYVDAATTGCQAGSPVALNDGTNVNVAFGTGTYAVGDRFRFYVSYPYLRADITNSKMCFTCHKDRHMSTANVDGIGPIVGTGADVVFGTTVFHHPVGDGVALATTPLDANGSAQPADGDTSNDLSLGTGGVVSCLSCHRVHNADSNSLTADP